MNVDMHRTRRRLAGSPAIALPLSLALASALALAVVSPAAAQVEIEVWTFGTLIYPEEILQDFTAETGIRARVDVRPFTDRTEGLPVAIAAGVPPDLSYLNNDFVPIFQSIGALEPLDEYMPQSFIDDYPRAYMDSLMIDGRRWQWPIFESPYNVLINADLFRSVGLDPDDPPYRWSDIVRAAERILLVDSEGTPVRAGIQFGGSAVSTQLGWQQVMFQFGGEFFAPDRRRVAFDSPESIRSLEFVVGLRERGIARPVPGGWYEGNAGMLMFTGGAPVEARSGGSRVPFEWRWGNVPEEARRITVGANGGYVMLALSQHKQEAAEFLRFITRPEVQAALLNEWGYITVRRSVQPENYGPNEWWARQQIQATAPYFEMRGQNHERVINQQHLSPLVWEAWEGRMPPAAALQEAARLANAYLAEQYGQGGR